MPFSVGGELRPLRRWLARRVRPPPRCCCYWIPNVIHVATLMLFVSVCQLCGVDELVVNWNSVLFEKQRRRTLRPRILAVLYSSIPRLLLYLKSCYKDTSNADRWSPTPTTPTISQHAPAVIEDNPPLAGPFVWVCQDRISGKWTWRSATRQRESARRPTQNEHTTSYSTNNYHQPH